MKKLLPFYITLLFMLPAMAQRTRIITFTPGSVFFISAGTTVAFDSLVLLPSANVAISGDNFLQKTTTLAYPSANNYVRQVYDFSTPVTPFSGTILFYYSDAALNGLPEGSLTLNVHDGTQWRAYPAGVTRNVVNNSIATAGILNSSLLELALAAGLHPLPVSFSHLQAVCSGTALHLQWKAAAAAVSFEIESSSDAVAWQQVGTVKAQAPDDADYAFTAPGDAAYYRLAAVQADGRKMVSAVLKSPCNGNNGRLQVYPNPAAMNVVVAAPAAQSGTATFTLLDGLGKPVQQTAQTLHKGTNLLTLDIARLPAGAYTLLLTQGARSKQVRFVKR